MSVSKYNKTTGELVTLASGVRMWVGAKTAHDLAVQQGTMPNNVMVCITDDYQDTNPVGMIVAFGGTAAPTDWLLCDGSAVSRTTYADLFAVIGTAFGSGDGSTTFNLPDLREATTKGVGLTGKSNNHMDADGLAIGEFIEDRVQEHQHGIKYSGTGNIDRGLSNTTPNMGPDYTKTVTITSGQGSYRSGATTEVKAVGVNYIIKAKCL